jgi:HSP20 family protein
MLYRRNSYPTVWDEMNRLQKELDQVFKDTYNNPVVTPQGFPAMNVWTGEEGAVVNAEIPGVDPADIDVSIVGETLTIRGERKTEDLGSNFKYHRQERGYGKFVRTIQLPFPVDSEKVEATLDRGVLTLSLPRAEEDKPRKISIKG